MSSSEEWKATAEDAYGNRIYTLDGKTSKYKTAEELKEGVRRRATKGGSFMDRQYNPSQVTEPNRDPRIRRLEDPGIFDSDLWEYAPVIMLPILALVMLFLRHMGLIDFHFH